MDQNRKTNWIYLHNRQWWWCWFCYYHYDKKTTIFFVCIICKTKKPAKNKNELTIVFICGTVNHIVEWITRIKSSYWWCLKHTKIAYRQYFNILFNHHIQPLYDKQIKYKKKSIEKLKQTNSRIVFG